MRQEDATTDGGRGRSLVVLSPKGRNSGYNDPTMTLAIRAHQGAVTEGSTAPPFSLPSKPGQVEDVASVIGRRPVVLLFFPLAFSSVCTAEMCHFRDDWSRWSALDAQVYGISVDSPFVTDRFRQVERIPFPILSDFNKEVSARYGVLLEELMGLRGVSTRAAFVIDRRGIVVYAKIQDSPKEQVDFGAIERAVKAC